jgi:general secretion pathway protein D
MINPMRLWLFILVGCVCLAGNAADKHPDHVSKKDRQMAAKEFSRAMELQKSGRVEDALQAMVHAVELYPGNIEYLTAREMLRQQLVGGYLTRGNRMAQVGDKTGAAEQFREALSMDAENGYLQQRLRDVSPPEDPEHRHTLEMLASVDQINITPTPGNKSIHVRGDTRAVYTQIGQVFNVAITFDNGLIAKSLRFDLDDVDFYTAMSLAAKMTRTFWAPVSSRQIMVATDTPELRRQYERLSLRTFYLGNATSASDVNDLANVLRNIFEIKIVSVEAGRNAITVRAPRETVEAAGLFIEEVMEARPEVMLDVQALEYDTNKTARYGLGLPTSFEAFNVYSEINRVLGSDAQNVINQLAQTGTIDPSTIPASTLASLQGSPLLAPFVFFGKGLGLTGVSTRPITGSLSLNKSEATVLEHVTLRALDGEKATLRVGERFPIALGAFSTVAISGQGAANLGTVPQFQYEDLGLTLTVTPHYQAAGEIKMDFDLQIQALGTASLNNVPELTNRSFKGNITTAAGEPSVLAGEVTDQELRSTNGYPGIGQVAGLSTVVNTNARQRTHTQLIVVVTPYLVRRPFHDHGTSVFWNLH